MFGLVPSAREKGVEGPQNGVKGFWGPKGRPVRFRSKKEGRGAPQTSSMYISIIFYFIIVVYFFWMGACIKAGLDTPTHKAKWNIRYDWVISLLWYLKLI